MVEVYLNIHNYPIIWYVGSTTSMSHSKVRRHLWDLTDVLSIFFHVEILTNEAQPEQPFHTRKSACVHPFGPR
jgi:hypothetical protein